MKRKNLPTFPPGRRKYFHYIFTVGNQIVCPDTPARRHGLHTTHRLDHILSINNVVGVFGYQCSVSGYWKRVGYFVAWTSIVVGIAGVVYHLDGHFFYERTLKSLTYTAPFAAPLAYVGLGCLLLMNRMIPHQSREWSQWVLFFSVGGLVGNFVLSLADHAANAFSRWTEWIPVVSSAMAVGFLFTQLVCKTPSAFRRLCNSVLLLQVVVGTLGFGLHFWSNLHSPAVRFIDQLLSGAPPFAPLLLPNLSLLAWIALRAESGLSRG